MFSVEPGGRVTTSLSGSGGAALTSSLCSRGDATTSASLGSHNPPVSSCPLAEVNWVQLTVQEGSRDFGTKNWGK